MRLNRPVLILDAVMTGFTAPLEARPQAPAQPAGRAKISIPRVDTAPKIEDYIGDERAAGVHITGFLQRDPGDLTPPSESTDAYLSHDDTHLYAVFVCRAADPSRIRARVARREQVFGDDIVGLFLDPFNDRQRSYMFFANPLGIQADGITTDGRGDDMSFDTVWQSEGRLTDFGYVVSLAIPFKSLRFPSGTASATWGVALSRTIAEKNEADFWPAITRRVNGFAAQFAEAQGLDDVSPGRNIQIIPYETFTGARFLDRGRAAFDSEAEGRTGVDAKVVVRDAVTFDFTVNPDFSQVESDEPQVTVNQRFEVFFPERRPFFLENANYFQTPINLFFSRRIRDRSLAPARQAGLGDGRWGPSRPTTVARGTPSPPRTRCSETDPRIRSCAPAANSASPVPAR